MAGYRYPVYFEIPAHLVEKHTDKIRNYFQIVRKSGGGECDAIELVEPNIYKVAFKDQEAQERVLNKKEHVIGDVHLSVRSTIHVQAQTTECPGASAKPSDRSQNVPSGDQVKEKHVQLSLYLLQFLTKCQKARDYLEGRLAPLSCSFELCPEAEEAVVRGVARGDHTDKWEARIEKVFEDVQSKYTCHYEVDQKRLKALQDIVSSAADNLQLYNDVPQGFGVLVGEETEVQQKLQKVDALQWMQETKIECRLSDMQYGLVKEKYEREFGSQHPAVKLTRKDTTVRVLEGPEKEVRGGRDKLLALLEEIQEKRVCFDPALVDFLKVNGAVQGYQARFERSLRYPVALEVGVDLGLFSLSPEALEEAAAIVQKDFRLETVDLEGAEAVQPGLDVLKNALREAEVAANRQGSRVQVGYKQAAAGRPPISIRLWGYSDEVDKLKQVLLDYKVNNVRTQESVPLPHPEMVDCFPKVLDLIGLTSSGVEVWASHLPTACAFLSGPKRLVQDVQNALTPALARLTWRVVELREPGAFRYFQDDKLGHIVQVYKNFNVVVHLMPQEPMRVSAGVRPGSGVASPTPTASSPAQTQQVSVRLEVVFGTLEEQQADVLIAPILNTELLSTQFGKSLVGKTGTDLTRKFSESAKGRKLNPGEVLEVNGCPGLGCQRICFIACVPWDGATGNAAQALRCGLNQALRLCEQQLMTSVALPVMGPGIALRFPCGEAANTLADQIGLFGRSNPKNISTIRIVVKHNKSDSEEIFTKVCQGLELQLQNQSRCVFQSLTTDVDVITAVVGGVQMQVMLGDITREATDVVVNTTDFADFSTDVCNDILALAGSEVKRILSSAQVGRGEILETEAGSLPCKGLMHVCGSKDTGVIRTLAKKIVVTCDLRGHKSVTIPAICAGAGGLSPQVVAEALMQGINDAILSTHLQNLTTVRFVLNKIPVFLEFKTFLQKHFTVVQPTNEVPATDQETQPPSGPDLSPLWAIDPEWTPAKLLVIGQNNVAIGEAEQALRQAFKAQHVQKELSMEELSRLTKEDVTVLASKLAQLELQVEPVMTQGGGCILKGLKDDVQDVCSLVQNALQGALLREVRKQEEERLYLDVAWCLQSPVRGWKWERFPPEANYLLEKNEVQAPIKDAQQREWTVDLTTMEARSSTSGQTVKIKRLKNLPDFAIPLYWDNMNPGKDFLVFNLSSSSPEYTWVKAEFARTTSKTIQKIERIQNVHLRRGYEVMKKQLEAKYRSPEGAAEKLLYHGTKAASCDPIQKTGFNRSFSGQNATRFGQGVYFALNASYSANTRYSEPDTAGVQRMFLTRVLTGQHTLGSEDMRVPPLRTALQGERYDSLVDNQNNPTLFVVFHDNQAYPDYLITFK